MMILLSFLQSLSFLSLSHHHLLSRPPNEIIYSTLQGLIKLHVPPPRARQRGHVHQPPPGLRRPRQRQVFASGRQKCAESTDGRAHVPQAQHRHLSPEDTRTRRAGPRVADHVRVSLLCGPAAYAVQRRVGHAVQGQRLQGRGDDCVFSVGQTGQRRGGRGPRERRTVKNKKRGCGI